MAKKTLYVLDSPLAIPMMLGECGNVRIGVVGSLPTEFCGELIKMDNLLDCVLAHNVSAILKDDLTDKMKTTISKYATMRCI